MTKITTQFAGYSALKSDQRFNSRSWGWRSCGVAAGLGGGIIASVVGSFLTCGSWLMSGWIGQFEHTTGTLLLLLTIPLLVLGAHCLDLIERQKEKTKRRQGESS